MVRATLRSVTFALLSFGALATAHAQAPGDTAPPVDTEEPPVVPPRPPSAPVVDAPVAAPAPPPAACTCAQPTPAPAAAAPAAYRRLSVGLGYGKMEVTSQDVNGGNASFDFLQLSVRYRGWRAIELEGSYLGGKEQLETGGDGILGISILQLGARYHLNPDGAWGVWLYGGAGQTKVARRDATDLELDDAKRWHLAFGGGLGHQWNRFAVQLELRGYVIGQTESEAALASQGVLVTDSLSAFSASLAASFSF